MSRSQIRNVTTPPKVSLDYVLATICATTVEEQLLRGLHAGLTELEQAGWIDDDYYESLLILWSNVTGVAFRDTLPTYTLEIDGKPLTGAMVAETLGKVNDVRPPEVCEAILQAEPISIFGVQPTMSDEIKPTAEQQAQETAANTGGPPNTAGAAAPFYDTVQAAAEADLYYNKTGAVEHAQAVIETAEAQEKAAQEKLEEQQKLEAAKEENAENTQAQEAEENAGSKHGKHHKHGEESNF